MPETYTPLPPHAVPAEAAAYVAAMSPKERELHDLAVQLLGSSYFVEWSHGFKKWSAAQAANVATAAAQAAQAAQKAQPNPNPAQ